MLKLWKNKRNDLYIFFTHHDVRKLTCLTTKFQEEPIEPIRGIPGEVIVYDENSSFGAVKKYVRKQTGVDALLPMLFELRFSKSFQSDNYVYYDLNNITFEFFM